jgi:hypothetical protein
MNDKKKIGLYQIGGYIFALVLADIGSIGLKKFPEYNLIDFSLIILGFILAYFSNYISKINRNEEEIEEVKGDIKKLKQNLEIDEKLLNTIKDIILLENNKDILNKLKGKI